MKTGRSNMQRLRPIIRFLLPFSCGLILLGLLIGYPLPVKADAGGWPTNTPTVTLQPSPTPYPTATPTGALLPFPVFPTATSTQDAALLSQNPNPPNFAIQNPAPESQSSGFSLLAFWPFAVVGLFIVGLVVWWIRKRGMAGVP